MATIAVFLALGGGALAATSFTGSDGQIHGCVGKKGALTVIKQGKKCGKGSTAIAWNQKGQTGARGAACLASDPNCKGSKGDPCPSTDPNCKGPAGAPGSPAASFLGSRFQENTDTLYADPIGSSSTSANESDVSLVSPASPIVARDLYVLSDDTRNYGRDYTLMVNGAATALSCTIAPSTSHTPTPCSNATDAVSIPAGSTISLRFRACGGGCGGGVGASPFVRVGWRATTP
jgi:hypothetical protein